jgi:hypothetical protein
MPTNIYIDGNPGLEGLPKNTKIGLSYLRSDSNSEIPTYETAVLATALRRSGSILLISCTALKILFFKLYG